MKRLFRRGGDRLPIDTSHTDRRRLLKSGGVSFLLHMFLILFLMAYLGASGSNGGGGGGGGSSIYQVTIRPLASRNSSDFSSAQRTYAAQTDFAKTKIQKDEDGIQVTAKQPTPESITPIPEPRSGDEPEKSTEDPAVGTLGDGEGLGEGGSGSGGRGSGGGAGWSFFGLKGFGRSGVSSPRYIENPKPTYPLEARQHGYHGKVLLKVEVLTNGRVGKVEVEKSSGYEVLDQSALKTMKTWRFIPAKRGRVPIRSWVNILITFQLQDSNF